MPSSLREEITKTFTRLARLAESRSREQTVVAVPDPRAGRQFGAYEIISRLGSGGMGQVYLALDKRLGRYVAVKFLAPEFVSDQLSLMRLVQEARTASALNHPNILTIFDVGELEGEHFIVSEYVEGTTLRTALETNALNTPAAIEIASQIASALSAAHAAGVIHRDLKPTNVMLRPDGYIKVIDFGLAKRLAPSTNETQLMQAELTRPGTTLGTIEYMSPEQARGDEVDARTDIWSFGIILYEMLAGHRPFEGPTANHVLVAIQDQPLPALPAVKTFPPGVQEILRIALAKKPTDRYHSAADMLQALQTASGDTHSVTHVRIAAPPRRVNRRVEAIVVACVLALLIVSLGVFFWRRAREPLWLRLEPLRQLTFNGRTLFASISPDGKYLAYSVGQAEGQQALYLKQLDSPDEEVKIPAREILYRGLTFDPDSQKLYVVEKDASHMGRLYAMPLFGQHPSAPMLLHIDGPVSFSPSGDQFAYVDVQTAEQRLMLANSDGQHTRVLLSLNRVVMLLRPAWSPDGTRIAVMLFREHPQSTGEAILDLVKLDGSESRRVMPGWQRIGHLRWTPDGKSILTDVGTSAEPNKTQIHQVAVETGVDRVLTNDLAAYTDISLSANAAQITAVKTDSKASVWVSRPNDFTRGDTAPAQAERQASLSWADAQHLILDSRRNGYPNFALLDLETQSFSALTNEKHVEQSAAAVPGSGGKAIVFASNRSGEFHIWRFDSEANKMQQLTFGSSYDEQPSLSPDGKWIVYASYVQDLSHLMKVPASGGQVEQIASYSAQDPQISPDGKWIACSLHDPASGKWSVAVIPFNGSADPRVIPGASAPFRWSPDNSSLTTTRTNANGVSNLWRIPLDGEPPVQLTQFEDESILALAWSPLGDRIACLRANVGADVALFKNAN